jgi:hypothetical protein
LAVNLHHFYISSKRRIDQKEIYPPLFLREAIATPPERGESGGSKEKGSLRGKGREG